VIAQQSGTRLLALKACPKLKEEVGEPGSIGEALTYIILNRGEEDVSWCAPVETVSLAQNDICQTFKQDMKALYLLCLLLTGSEHCAEQCFVSSLSDSMNLRATFADWNISWIRHVVVRNAIRMMPLVMKSNKGEASSSGQSGVISSANTALHGVLRLETFERFVFVMSMLEGYSDHECAQLLRASARGVSIAKEMAFRHLAAPSSSKESLRSYSRARRFSR